MCTGYRLYSRPFIQRLIIVLHKKYSYNFQIKINYIFIYIPSEICNTAARSACAVGSLNIEKHKKIIIIIIVPLQRPLIIIITNLHFLCYHLSTPVQNVNTHIHNYCGIVHFFNLIFAPFKWMQSDKCYAKYFLIKFTTLTYHLMPPQVKLILSCFFLFARSFHSRTGTDLQRGFYALVTMMRAACCMNGFAYVAVCERAVKCVQVKEWLEWLVWKRLNWIMYVYILFGFDLLLLFLYTVPFVIHFLFSLCLLVYIAPVLFSTGYSLIKTQIKFSLAVILFFSIVMELFVIFLFWVSTN